MKVDVIFPPLLELFHSKHILGLESKAKDSKIVAKTSRMRTSHRLPKIYFQTRDSIKKSEDARKLI